MNRPSPWQELSTTLRASAVYKELAARSRAADGTIELARLPVPVAAWALDLVAEDLARPVLAIVPHEADALAWTEAARLFAGAESAIYFPSPPLSPYQETNAPIAAQALEVVALDRAASGAARVVVATPRGLFRRLPRPEALNRRHHSIEAGAACDRDALVERLVNLGYRRVDLVAEVGDFAVRGGVVDLFPAGNARPVRADFFGDRIDELSSFEAETQRSLETLARVRVPALTLFATDRKAAAHLAARLRAWLGDDTAFERAEKIAALERGTGFPGWESLLPAAEGMTVTLADYIGAPLVVAVDAETSRRELEHHAERLAAEFDARQEHGRFAVPPEAVEHPAAGVRAMLDAARISIAPLPAAAGRALDFAAAATDVFHGQLPRFPREVESATVRGDRVLLVAPAERFSALTELLEGRDVRVGGARGVELVAGEIARGFRLPAAGVVVFAEAQLLARAEAREGARRGRRRAVSAFLAGMRDLKVGDFVVHADHGIGQFVALRKVAPTDTGASPLPPSLAEERESAALESEVMEILYSAGKRLLVPLARLDLLQKYSGIEGLSPRLDQLGGTSWNRAKARAKRAMRDMAEELLKLYAERQLARAPALAGDSDYERQFAAAFPYDETADQAEAIATIAADLATERPMDRLLVGDVGFGKTEVAMRAAFRAIERGYQVAVLAPTTILADQHLETFRTRFEGFPVTIERLSRQRTGKDLAELRERIAAGKVDIVVGTHRLLSQDVAFHRLGIAVIDEEQRFGVAQKERLKHLKRNVHVLAMTATPLPRTLQLSLAGVRDLSVIETPPKDRMAVETVVVPLADEVVREAIEFELERGGQIYYVYNRVESIDERAAWLHKLLPNLRVVVAHGQLDERELSRRMHAFKTRQYDLLLATTIIENGIDIPTVNTMLVHRADRFGLAQLYQLRGRVGRSHELGYCYLLVSREGGVSIDAERRLEALRDFTELGAGFRIAARDLEIRGAGNLLGGEQSGHIAELGIETYLKMLEETVRELKGEGVEEAPSVALDLPVPMSIPENYIGDANVRMEIYRKLATAQTAPEEMAAELADRFGRPPREVVGLLEVAALKRLAERLRVQTISLSNGKLSLRMRRDAKIDVDRLIRFVSERDGAAFSPTGVLTLDLDSGQSPVAAARAALEELAA